MKHNGYLSYAWQDRHRIDIVLQKLRETGIVFTNLNREVEAYVSRIELGQDLRVEIRKQIEAADTVVVFWTKEASVSDWVQYEIGLADALRKSIVVVLEGTAPQIPGSMVGSQIIVLNESGEERD